jgi:hypothetical protein
MRAGRLSMRECLHWASQRRAEVPLLNGEFEFLAVATPEIVNDLDLQAAPHGAAAAAARHATPLRRPRPTPDGVAGAIETAVASHILP